MVSGRGPVVSFEDIFSLLRGQIQPIAREFLIQQLAAYPELLGCLGAISRVCSEGSLDKLDFHPIYEVRKRAGEQQFPYSGSPEPPKKPPIR